MIAPPSSWQPAEARSLAVPAAAGVALFALGFALLHVGGLGSGQIVDTPLYQLYAQETTHGRIPYRDFALEYPPGALAAFLLPALVAGTADATAYRAAFEGLMAVCGAAAVLLVALALHALGAPLRRALPALALTALAPLLLGSVVLTRFDLLPAALVAGAVAALLCGRGRLALAVLGFATAVKLYPAALAPLALVHLWRRHGRREALTGVLAFAAPLVACAAPFLALAPGGLWDSVVRQASRPLQIESLGAALLVAAHHLGGVRLTVVTTYGSQNLAGSAADALAIALSVAQALALLALWTWLARGPADRERLLRAAAAALCVLVALGKVLSPQFLVWLPAAVALVCGRRGLAAGLALAAALVLTQLWFPHRYWDLPLRLAPFVSALVLARDLVLVALLGVLVWPQRAPPGSGA